MHGARVALIGAPTDVGAGVRGACMGPQALRVAGLVQALQSQGASVIDTGDLAGLRHALSEALQGVDADTHLHVSFDLDVLDPVHAPGVSTGVPGGLTYREMQLCMEMIADTGCLGSLDVMEINPARDVRNRTAELAVQAVCSLLGAATLAR
jgi:arginase